MSGPLSLTNRSQISANDAGYWMASLGRIAVGGAALNKAYRRLFALLEGGAHQILVPVFDKANAPWPTPGVYGAGSTKFTDGTRFTDGTAFGERAILVTLASGAAARATSISATVAAAATIVGGEYFEIGVGHLHVIAAINNDGSWKIWPPLREAASAGAILDFDNPECRMRLTGEDADDLALEMGRYGFPDLNFVEDLSS